MNSKILIKNSKIRGSSLKPRIKAANCSGAWLKLTTVLKATAAPTKSKTVDEAKADFVKIAGKSLSLRVFKTKNEIIIGSRLAKRLNVKIGDKITIVSANGIKTVLGIIPQKQIFKIGGLFNVGMYEFDNNFIFMPWKSAQNFLQL